MKGSVTDKTYAPRWREAGWAGRRYRLGKNKEVFDAEPYASYQASKTLGNRSEQDQDHTILSDSTAAATRSQPDDTGPGQRFAIAVIEMCSHLASWGTP